MAASSHSLVSSAFFSTTPARKLSGSDRFPLAKSILCRKIHGYSGGAVSAPRNCCNHASSDDQSNYGRKLMDSIFVACTSVALSFSLYITDVDPASAFVVTSPRKLDTDELATVRLFQENTPSVVYITNLASR